MAASRTFLSGLTRGGAAWTLRGCPLASAGLRLLSGHCHRANDPQTRSRAARLRARSRCLEPCSDRALRGRCSTAALDRPMCVATTAGHALTQQGLASPRRQATPTAEAARRRLLNLARPSACSTSQTARPQLLANPLISAVATFSLVSVAGVRQRSFIPTIDGHALDLVELGEVVRSGGAIGNSTIWTSPMLDASQLHSFVVRARSS